MNKIVKFFACQALCLMMSQTLAAQEAVWCLVTDGGQAIAMSRVCCLLAADDDSTFSVILSDGGAVEQVRRATFARQVPTPELKYQDNPLGIHNVAMLSGLPDDTPVEVFAANGQCMLRATAACVPVGELPQGIYLVRIKDKTFKIKKQ